VSGARIQVVIPCYNEADRLDAAAFAKALEERPDTSFVFVNDGSTDDTSAVLHALSARHPGRMAVLDQGDNMGKAEAVRQGLLRAFSSGAELAGYWDADLATPLDAIGDFVTTLDSEPAVDVVLGARVAMLGHRIERKATRHYAGRVFATLASMTLGLSVYDTQCGAKLFRCNEATRALFADPFGSRWVFDVELLARYLHRGGDPSGIREQALARWTDVPGSKVKPTDFVGGVLELARIKRRYPRRRSGG
jgi:glycosyltransferase involved in cell wall biosynthesis